MTKKGEPVHAADAWLEAYYTRQLKNIEKPAAQREQSVAKSDEEAARETRAVDNTGDYVMTVGDIARRIAKVRAEGRAAGMEEAARIVESYENSAHNTTNTVRAISAAIRAGAKP